MKILFTQDAWKDFEWFFGLGKEAITVISCRFHYE